MNGSSLLNLVTQFITLAGLVLGIYFGIKQEVIAATIALAVFFLVAFFEIYNKINRYYSYEVKSKLDNSSIKIFTLYNSDCNDREQIESIVDSRSSQVDIITHDTVDITTLTQHLQDTKPDGLLCFWNEKILVNHAAYFRIISEWCKQNEFNPALIIVDNKNGAKNDILDNIYRQEYRVVDLDSNVNPMILLTVKSINRTKLFINISRLWRRMFIVVASSIVVFVALVLFHLYSIDKISMTVPEFSGMYHSIPNVKGKQLNEVLANPSPNLDSTRQFMDAYIKDYLKYQEDKLKEILGYKQEIKIKYFRKFDDKYFTQITDGVHHQLLVDSSLVGFAVKEKVLVEWTYEKGYTYWDPETGDPKKVNETPYIIDPQKIKRMLVFTVVYPNSTGAISISFDNDIEIKEGEMRYLRLKIMELATLLAIVPDKYLYK